MRLVLMNGDTVANVIDVDPDNIPPDFAGAAVAPDGVGVGMLWNGATYEMPAPDPVTPAMVRAEAARRMSAITVTYTREERGTWPVQIAEAEAFTADDQASVPMLTAIAEPRGITVAQMAALVLTLRDQFKAATAFILAKQAALLAMEQIPQDFANDIYWS